MKTSKEMMPDPVKVLYIHHCGKFGGASRSLLELISSFPPNTVIPHLLTQQGNVGGFFEKKGVKTIEVKGVSIFDNGQYAYYRGLRWLILLREILFLPFTIAGLLKAKKHFNDLDIIHINEVQLLPVGLLAKKIFKKPLVCHARSLQRNVTNSWRVRLVHRMLEKCDYIFPIDRSVSDTLPHSSKKVIVYNTINIAPQNTSKEQPVATEIRTAFTAGMVGQLLIHKGVLEFVEAARICKERGYDIKFIMIGDDDRLKGSFIKKVLVQLRIIQDVRAAVHKLIYLHGLSETVFVKPFTLNLGEAYTGIDVLCFPNKSDAIGRPVFEAAFFKKPSIVCVTRLYGDTFIDNETGVNIKVPSAESLSEAIIKMYKDRDLARQMGEKAHQLVTLNHDPVANSTRVLSTYSTIR